MIFARALQIAGAALVASLLLAPQEAAGEEPAPEPVAAPVAAPLADADPAAAPPAVPGGIQVYLEGELLDDENRALSGVFPLRFDLFRSAASESPVWSESRWVTVHQGRYAIALGRIQAIPEDWTGARRVLEVSIEGLGTIATQVLEIKAWDPDARDPLPTIRAERFADLAGTAIRADQALVARNCRTLEGRSVNSLDRSAELRQRINEVQTRLDNPNQNRLAGDKVTLAAYGGPTGVPYERNCPPGYVMTGLRGGAGHVVDGFYIICTVVE